MPLTEPRDRNPQFWPLPQQSYDPPPNQAMAHPSNFELIEKRIYQLAQETALRFEAMRRMLSLDEGQLLATEKAIIAERTAPRGGVGQEEVVHIVQSAIEQNNEVIRRMLDSFIQTARPPQAPAPQPDPLNTEPGYDLQPEEVPAQTFEISETITQPTPLSNTNKPAPDWKKRKH